MDWMHSMMSHLIYTKQQFLNTLKINSLIMKLFHSKKSKSNLFRGSLWLIKKECNLTKCSNYIKCNRDIMKWANKMVKTVKQHLKNDGNLNCLILSFNEIYKNKIFNLNYFYLQ